MYHVTANNNLIKWETEKAYLLKLPKSKYKFWLSKKLVRILPNGYQVRIDIPNNFKIKIFKNGEGRYNKYKVVSEKEVDAEGLLKYFGMDFNCEIIEDLKDD